jgi:undecaprenyl-diphosphatase
MENLNFHLFALINAPSAFVDTHLPGLVVFLATWLIWVLPLMFLGYWLTGDDKQKQTMMEAAFSAVLALAVGGLMGWLWPHPRPFMLGMGRMLIPHSPDASLPSDHLTLWWSIALSLALTPRFRRRGLLLTAIGFAVAWARIYAGVHFPLDMLAALLVALAAAIFVRFFCRPLTAHATVVGSQLQRVFLGNDFES